MAGSLREGVGAEAGSGCLVRCRRSLFLELPFKPVVTKGFDRMGSALGAVAAAHVVGRAVMRTTPADAFWMFWVNRDFFDHCFIPCTGLAEIVTPSCLEETI
jgi:hypothetical protein